METMNKRYKILWIDDQYEELMDFNIHAENNDIDLDGYTSFEEGFSILEKDLTKYDGVLLDAMFFETKDQVQGTEDETGLGMAIARLNELKPQKLLPWFVLSGKESFTKNSNSILRANKKRCFDKTDGNDLSELFQFIKNEADEVEDTQIRHQYSKAFEACSVLGDGVQKPLLKVLKSIHNPNDAFDDELYFTQIRIILEYFFRAANKAGLLHDMCLEGGKVNLSESSLFMAGRPGKHLKICCSKSHFPKIIADNVWSIIAITGSASHTEDELSQQGKASVADYRRYIDTPYLLYSLTFQLIDILVWFKAYLNENDNYIANVALWQEINSLANEVLYTGIIEQDNNGNFYCGDYQLNNSYTEKNHKTGDKISILEASNNTNFRTKNTYSYFANRVRKA